MASERLQVILDLETGQYTRKARRASDSTREIGTSADQTGGKLQQLEGRFKAVGIAAGAALGAAAIAFAGDAIRSASDLGESINAVEKAFESGADTVLAFGEQAATAAGLSNAAFNQLVVPIGALLRNFGLDAQEAANQAVALTQRAADLASVFNTDVATALGAIQAALRGEGDPIEQFGANVSAARIEAYALAQGLVETKSEIDDNVKVMARLGLIFQDTDRFAGDFADTADSVANQVRTLTGEWENFKASTGEDLLGPASTTLTFAGRAVTALTTAFNFFKNPLDEVTRTLNQVPVSVNRLRREVGSFEGQEGAAFLQLLSNIPEQALESTDVLEAFADEIGITAGELEDLLDLLGDDGSWDSYGSAASGLAEILGITEEQAAELLPRLRELQSQMEGDQAVDAYGERYRQLAGWYKITGQDARGAAEGNEELAQSFLNVLQARRELISPVFAAAQAQQRQAEARDAVEEARTGDFDTEAERVEAVSRAKLDLLNATLDADVATEEYARTFRASFDDAAERAEDLNIDLLEVLETLGLLNDLAPVDLQIVLDLVGNLGGTFIPENDPRNFPRSDRPTRIDTTDPFGDLPSLGGVRGFATGGYSNAHETILVGEQGPELIRPRVPIEVIPNHQIGAGGGTTVVNLGGITVTGSALSEDPARLARHIRREMDRELADLRGGTV